MQFSHFKNRQAGKKSGELDGKKQIRPLIYRRNNIHTTKYCTFIHTKNRLLLLSDKNIKNKKIENELYAVEITLTEVGQGFLIR